LTSGVFLNLVPNFMDTSCGVSVNLSQLPSSTTPLHIVLWKGVDTATPTVTSTAVPSGAEPLNLETNETIKRLLDRITVLESMVSGLLETQKSSIWFSPGLRPTPTGIEVVSRRESVGEESNIGTVLSQLVRPSGSSNQSDVRTVTIAPLGTSVPPTTTAARGPEPEAGAEAEEEVEAEAEEEQVEVEEEAEEEQVEEQQVEEEQVEEQEEAEVEEQVEEQEEAEVEEEQVEEAEEAELEEEVIEYKEVQWKGQTYYVDGNEQAYEMDSDGDLVDTPIGVWREATQKLVRYKAS